MKIFFAVILFILVSGCTSFSGDNFLEKDGVCETSKGENFENSPFDCGQSLKEIAEHIEFITGKETSDSDIEINNQRAVLPYEGVCLECKNKLYVKATGEQGSGNSRQDPFVISRENMLNFYEKMKNYLEKGECLDVVFLDGTYERLQIIISNFNKPATERYKIYGSNYPPLCLRADNLHKAVFDGEVNEERIHGFIITDYRGTPIRNVHIIGLRIKNYASGAIVNNTNHSIISSNFISDIGSIEGKNGVEAIGSRGEYNIIINNKIHDSWNRFGTSPAKMHSIYSGDKYSFYIHNQIINSSGPMVDFDLGAQDVWFFQNEFVQENTVYRNNEPESPIYGTFSFIVDNTGAFPLNQFNCDFIQARNISFTRNKFENLSGKEDIILVRQITPVNSSCFDSVCSINNSLIRCDEYYSDFLAPVLDGWVFSQNQIKNISAYNLFTHHIKGRITTEILSKGENSEFNINYENDTWPSVLTSGLMQYNNFYPNLCVENEEQSEDFFSLNGIC